MKYIDAEKLIAEIERRMTENCKLAEKAKCFGDRAVEDNDILALIERLQQEQPSVQNGKFVFPKYIYARTKDNKTIDMSYAPQDMTAVEYIRNDFVEQEHLEVDLEKVIEQTYHDGSVADTSDMDHVDYENIARHFYELARQKYEK